MKAMSLREIATACSGEFYGEKEKLNEQVTSVVIDSRKAESGCLFVPIKGARVDGHTFIPQVMENGALCTLTEQPLGEVPYSYILVKSCEQALKDLAEHYRKALDITVVGVTGSVGKTSTKEMIAAVLSQKYKVLKTAGNFNNEIGLPLTIFNIREEHEVAVLEMGINHFGEMSRLAKVARPDICVITNIGLCHLENLEDREGVLRAKTEMFAYRRKDAKIILNGDDDKLITVKDREGYEPQYFGLSSQMDAYAEDVKSLSLKGTSCTLQMKGETIPVVIPIPGYHMVYNALAGALVGHALGLTCEQIKEGIESLVPVSGRNNLIETDKFLIIDDCYNANPISMKASLDVLATADSRKVAVLGDMFELGEQEKELHYEVGVHAAKEGIDLVVCIGELSNETAKGVKDANGNAVHFDTKTAFFDVVDKLLKEGDAVLVKASHGMEFPEIVERLKVMK